MSEIMDVYRRWLADGQPGGAGAMLTAFVVTLGAAEKDEPAAEQRGRDAERARWREAVRERLADEDMTRGELMVHRFALEKLLRLLGETS